MVVFSANMVLKNEQALRVLKRECEQGAVRIQQVKRRYSRSRCFSFLLCVSMLALVVAAAGLCTGLLVNRQYLMSNAVHRFQGFCTVPIINKKMDPQAYQMPVRFSSEPEVQVVNMLGDDNSDDVVNSLREELDIDGNVEKISVIDNGRRVNFTHDFDNNVTGIIDEQRCFIMDLDPEVVASPGAFVLGIERDDNFEVSLIHTTLHAALPRVRDFSDLLEGLTMFMDNCLHRPVYRLHKGGGIIIRKRSIDDPAHDYIQFSGKHVQKIEISNLQDILQEERKAKDETTVA